MQRSGKPLYKQQRVASWPSQAPPIIIGELEWLATERVKTGGQREPHGIRGAARCSAPWQLPRGRARAGGSRVGG